MGPKEIGMTVCVRARNTIAALCIGAAIGAGTALDVGTAIDVVAHAQDRKPAVEPQIGQAGKDVIWVPTPPELLEKMLDLAQVTPRDFVVDLGSGDGRAV